MVEAQREMPETVRFASAIDQKKSGGLGSYVLWAFVVIMVYVLSSGPMMLLGAKQTSFPPAIRSTYMPSFWMYQWSPFWKPFGIYWHLWCPGIYNGAGELTSLRIFKD
jgi:hypothetical protein